MKKIILSALVLINLFFTYSSFAYDLEGYDILDKDEYAVSHGLEYGEYKYKNKNNTYQKAFIYRYSSNSFTDIVPTFGNTLTSFSRLSNIISKLEDTETRVAGALNGDFFSFKTAIPMSSLVIDGEIVTTDDSRYALGFDEYNNPVISIPGYEISLNKNEKEYKIHHLNKFPSVYGIYLLNGNYGKTTKTESPSTEYIIYPYEYKLHFNEFYEPTFDGFIKAGEYYYKITKPHPSLHKTENVVIADVRFSSMNSEIPESAYVLCIDENYDFDYSLDLLPGEEFELEIRCSDPSWYKVNNAVGGGSVIVRDGEYTDEGYDKTVYDQNNPRTAAGIKENGEILFVSFDGRQKGYSTGITVKELSEFMISQGCKTVLNFDGGGSTTVFAALPGEIHASLRNRPSDGSERGISTALLFINSAEKLYEPIFSRIETDYKYIVSSGSFAKITEMFFYDGNFHAAQSTDVEFFCENDALVFDENKIYSTDVTGEIEVYSKIGDTVNSAGKIYVVDAPDKIEINLSKTLSGFGEEIDFDFDFYYKENPVALDSTKLLWEIYIGDDEECKDSFVLGKDNNYISEYVDIKNNSIVALKHDVNYRIKVSYDEAFCEFSMKSKKETFNDISLHWAYDYIMEAHKAGLFKADSDKSLNFFYPERKISREEFAVVFTRVLGIDTSAFKESELGYYDKNSISDWALESVCALEELGFLKFVSESDFFHPKEYISRLDAMIMVGSLIQSDEKVINIPYADIPELDESKSMFVYNSLISGIIGGFEDNTVRPYEFLTRAQAAVIFTRLYNVI